jgi:hypothetical protein
LFWPQQSEFVRMASRFGATIIPFGVVGEDDLCNVGTNLGCHAVIARGILNSNCHVL